MNFLGMGPMEILLIVVLALIVFGPAKLPEIMGQVGKAIGDFRRATSELSDEFNRTIQAEIQETKAIVDDTKSTVTGCVCGHQRGHQRDPNADGDDPSPRARGGRGRPSGLSNGTNGWSHETAAPAPTQPAVEVGATETSTASAKCAIRTGGPYLLHRSAAQPITPRKTPRRDDLLPPY